MRSAAASPLELSTARLELHPLRRDQLEELLAHWSVPDVGRWLFDDRLPEPPKVEEELEMSLRLFADRGLGIWGVYLPPDELIGTCGFLPVVEVDELEILFSIDPRHWRRGYALEASHAVLAQAFDHAGLDRVIGRCDVPNEPSRRLLERLGMRLDKREPIRGIDCFHFTLERADYLARSAAERHR